MAEENNNEIIEQLQQQIQRLQGELETALRNELILWRTVGPTLLESIQNGEATRE